MKIYHKIFIGLTATTLLLGCSKSELVERSPSIILADNLYVNKAGFDAGIAGLYNSVRRSRSGSEINTVNDWITVSAFSGTDNAYDNYAGVGQFNVFGAAITSSDVFLKREWEWLYETINAANTIITRAENPKVIWTVDQKNQTLAEARAIRAWCYRHLTYLWGDVPLTLTESSGTNIKTDWERTPVADVRKSMEDDWLFAEQYLPETSPLQGKILKGAVQHYLAELYLAEGKNDKARDFALKVTTNPNYKLVTARFGANASQPGTPFTDMFINGNANRISGNTEALWVMQAELGVIGGEADNLMRRYWVNRYYSISVGGKSPFLVSADNGGRGLGRIAATKWAVNLYPAGDDRGSDFAWRFSFKINNPNGVPAGYTFGGTYVLDKSSNEKVNNPNWPNTRKWDYASPIDPTVDRAYNDQIYIRSADTYLLLAEAYLKLSEPGKAADAINALRRRAHAPEITGADVTLDFILDERSRELFSEEERRYTLIRTGKLIDRVKLYNKLAGPNITNREKLMPIPQSVIDANLTKVFPQNPDY